MRGWWIPALTFYTLETERPDCTKQDLFPEKTTRSIKLLQVNFAIYKWCNEKHLLLGQQFCQYIHSVIGWIQDFTSHHHGTISDSPDIWRGAPKKGILNAPVQRQNKRSKTHHMLHHMALLTQSLAPQVNGFSNKTSTVQPLDTWCAWSAYSWFLFFFRW